MNGISLAVGVGLVISSMIIATRFLFEAKTDNRGLPIGLLIFSLIWSSVKAGIFFLPTTMTSQEEGKLIVIGLSPYQAADRSSTSFKAATHPLFLRLILVWQN